MDINADTLDAAPRTVHKQMAHLRPHTWQGYNLFQGWRDVVTVLLPQDRSRSLEEVGLAPVEAYAVYDFVNGQAIRRAASALPQPSLHPWSARRA